MPKGVKMDTPKSLSVLADGLRNLQPTEKQEYLRALDNCMQKMSGRQTNPFSLQSVAFSIYYSLEREPYTQPEFPSQATRKDIQARKKFNTVFSGVVAYTKASDKERAAFKKRVLKKSNLFLKLNYLIKMYQNTRE